MNGKAVFQGGNAQSLDNVAGQPIAEYTHSKSGTVHKLEGPSKARNIVFKATGDYNDGDTWTLNNHPVTVTYNGGEELLPTAVLVGDVVQAVVMGDKLRLMLQKPTPQESILDNGNLIKPVNQRTQDNYTGGAVYAFDRWVLVYGDGGSAANITLSSDGVKINGSGGIRQFFEADLKGRICTIAVLDGENKLFTATSPILNTESSEWQIGKHLENMWIGFRFREDRGKSWDLTITGIDKTIKAVKIELGNRFTGWPAWDYGTELRKCQRYLLGIRPDNYKERIIPIGQGVATTNGKVRVLIPTPVSMRTRPVFNVDINNLRVASTTPDVENGIIPDTVNNMFYSNGLIFIDVYAKGLTAGNAYELYLFGTTTETMLFSAEL